MAKKPKNRSPRKSQNQQNLVFCVDCKTMVSKRSTVALESLGAGKGRACRVHPVVQALQEKSKQTSAQEKLEKAAQARVQILMLTSYVRSTHTIRGTPLSVLYQQIEQSSRFSADVLRAVQDEVAEEGAVMSEDEITSTMLCAGGLHKRATDLGLEA